MCKVEGGRRIIVDIGGRWKVEVLKTRKEGGIYTTSEGSHLLLVNLAN